MSEGFVRVASAADIEANASKSFPAGGLEILVCHTKDGFLAVENRCTHQLTELEGGKIRGCYIFCPLHGQRFDLRDGKAIGQLTDKPLRTFALKVEAGEIYVNPSAPAEPG